MLLRRWQEVRFPCKSEKGKNLVCWIWLYILLDITNSAAARHSAEVYSSTAFIKIISRLFGILQHTHKGKIALKGIFSSLLMSPPQFAHPCWEANVILSTFPVSSPHVAGNEPETQRNSSKMSGKHTVSTSFEQHLTWWKRKVVQCL